jgi:hypothetical protein
MGLIRGNTPRYVGIDLFSTWVVGTAFLIPLWRYGRRPFWNFAAALVTLTYISSLFGLFFFFLYRRRLGDAWFSPVPPMGAIFLLSIALYTPHRLIRWGAVALAVVPLGNLILSFTRANWIGFILALGLLIWIYIQGAARRGAAVANVARTLLPFIGVALAALLVAQVLLGGDIGNSLEDRFSSSFTTKTSGNTYSNLYRLVEWSAAGARIVQNPLLGYGAGATLEFTEPVIALRRETPYIHNMYLFQQYKYGIPGLAALIGLFLSFSLAGRKEALGQGDWKRRALGAAVFGNTLMMAEISAFDFVFAHVGCSLPLAMMWGALLPVVKRDGKQSVGWGEAA